MKSIKKTLSILLCLAMILSSAAMVFAGEGIEEETDGFYFDPDEVTTTVKTPEPAPEAADAIYGNVGNDTVVLVTTTAEPKSTILDSPMLTILDDPETTIVKASAGTVFTDLDTEGWYMDAINYCYEKGLMNGVTEDSFAPGSTLTRAMAVTVLWRLDGEKYVNYLMPFEDIDMEGYYTEALRWASSEKIVGGTSETTFEPDRAITKEELAAMIYNYEKHLGGGFTGMWMYFLPLEDRAEISEFATEAVYWLYMKQVITGSEGKFNPLSSATRAEFAQMIMKYAKLNDTEEEPQIAGGWTASEDGTISETVKGYFDKAFEGFTGVGYTPVKLLETQVVAGRNYKFLCDAKTITYPPTTYQAEVVIYVALDGTCSITSITKLEK